MGGFDKSEVLNRPPRTDELLMTIADLKVGRSMPQLVWNQLPRPEGDASTSQADAAIGPSSGSTMMPPGTRLLAFVSLDHSWDNSATWMVGEMSWLFSLELPSRVPSRGRLLASSPEVAEGGTAIDRRLEPPRITCQDVEPPVPYRGGCTGSRHSDVAASFNGGVPGVPDQRGLGRSTARPS